MRAPPESLSPTEGSAVLHGQVHDLDDLLGEHVCQRPTEKAGVLREDVHVPPRDLAIPDDDPASDHLPVIFRGSAAPGSGEHVELDEAPRVEQLDHPFARRLPALLVPGLDVFEPAAVKSLCLQRAQSPYGIVIVHV